MDRNRDLADLERLLLGIDRQGYGAYNRIAGAWHGKGFDLLVDHVQRDPFATPSKLRLRIPYATHRVPPELWRSPPRKVAVEDFLLRAFAAAVRGPRGDGSGRSGEVAVDAGGAEILARSGCELFEDRLELRFRVGLPAAGRSVLGRQAAELLCRRLPLAAEAVLWRHLNHAATEAWADLAEDHALLQAELPRHGLVAFVRDGSLLPRRTGISEEPLPGAVPFASPEALRVRLPTRHHGEVAGMGIPDGVTLVTGGGFHGKTTLLEALQLGVYPHVPGDGREWVVTRAAAVKVRSEDGRAVAGVDVRPFIDDLPGGKSTAFFSTQDASGSTSLAAAILEAIEVGADALLLDEDTCSTNLLVRDARMQALVSRETITPLVDRAREIVEILGVSLVLVVGGNGDYLDVADTVVLMEDYLPRDATAESRRVARERPTGRAAETPKHPLRVTPRAPLPASFDPRRGNRDRIKARGRRELVFGEEEIDLSALEQLVDDSQSRAIGAMLQTLRTLARPGLPLRDLLRDLEAEVERRGLYGLDPSPELALPRLFEVAAAVNRLRGLAVTSVAPEDPQGTSSNRLAREASGSAPQGRNQASLSLGRESDRE
ncbi:MAG: ABC-ATPase domain-containing protein [Chloroflexota bacterium]|nr:ABC-ATPase domain-containing protein [Chloroflexota bacterium]